VSLVNPLRSRLKDNLMFESLNLNLLVIHRYHCMLFLDIIYMSFMFDNMINLSFIFDDMINLVFIFYFVGILSFLCYYFSCFF
jgi:hypothetical protein